MFLCKNCIAICKIDMGVEYEMRPSTIKAGTAFEKIKEIEERGRQ